jgi:hypothetical protein
MVACTWTSASVVALGAGMAAAEGLSPNVWVGLPWCRKVSFML